MRLARVFVLIAAPSLVAAPYAGAQPPVGEADGVRALKERVAFFVYGRGLFPF